MENPRKHGQSYNKWLGNKKPCYRELICADIDAALDKHPNSFEELLRMLEASGYQIKYGKVPSLLGSGQKRFIRMDSLGEESLSDLGADNRSIQAIYAFAKTIDSPDIQKDLYSCLRLACDALCAVCDSLNLDPDVLDYWDGRSEIIVTPFDPRA